jgi:hypothetical protein
MFRRLLPIVLLAALALPATAGAARPGSYVPGQPIDGPSADIQRLGDLDVARDGTGALTYVKAVAGVDHVFISRLVGGAFQVPEQLDAGAAGASSQPVVAAGDGGSLVAAWVNAGTLFVAVRPPGAAAFAPAQALAAGASDPDVDLGVDEVAYVTWTAAGNVMAARKDRGVTAFTVLGAPLDLVPAAVAGVGTGRSRVAVPADGSAIVVWGEAGHVVERRLFGVGLSAVPQDLGAPADLPDVAAEDDSSFAWVVYRQGGASLARRLVGSSFDPPAVLATSEQTDLPRVAIDGDGVGYAGVSGAASLGAFGAVLKDDRFNPGLRLGGGFGAVPAAVPAVDETGDGLVAFQQGLATGNRVIVGRPYDYDVRTRAVTRPRRAVALSNPALGPTDAARGLEAKADRVGDIVVAFAQGDGPTRRIVAGGFDRAPAALRALTSRVTRSGSLRWTRSFDLWGAIRYAVFVDRRRVALTTRTSIRLPRRVHAGRHRWRVVAIDRRLQTRSSTPRRLQVLPARRRR